jgi:hypothetical protein
MHVVGYQRKILKIFWLDYSKNPADLPIHLFIDNRSGVANYVGYFI